MPVYPIVEILQLIIFIIVFRVSSKVWKLPKTYAIAAAVLSLPSPVFFPTSGRDTFCYACDLYVIFVFAARFIQAPPRLSRYPIRNRFLFVAGFMLVVWPLITTTINILLGGELSDSFLIESLFRGCTYFLTFYLAMEISNDSKYASQMIAATCIGFALVSTCGLLQYYTGIDLDLWFQNVKSRAFYTGTTKTQYGTGFMGLYRGAVGAWAVVTLTAIPLTLMSSRKMWFVTPLCIAIILAGVLGVGSRQGILFGVLGLLLGFAILIVICRKRRMPFAKRMLPTAVMLLLIGLYATRNLSTTTSTWLTVRLGNTDTNRTYALDIAEGFLESHYIMNGVGIEAETQWRGQPDDFNKHIFFDVDSEIVWVMEQGGVVLILTYLCFMISLLRYLSRFTKLSNPDDMFVVGTGFGVAVVGCCLSIGHFFLLHVGPEQAPISYWDWAVLGLSVGVLSRVQEKPSKSIRHAPLSGSLSGEVALRN